MDFKKLWVLTSILTVSGILLGTYGSISAYAGNQSNITLGDAHFAPLNGTTNYQIKSYVNYSVSDPTLIGQKLNCRHEGTFIKWNCNKDHILSPRVHSQ
jgi:hypothetical protein